MYTRDDALHLDMGNPMRQAKATVPQYATISHPDGHTDTLSVIELQSLRNMRFAHLTDAIDEYRANVSEAITKANYTLHQIEVAPSRHELVSAVVGLTGTHKQLETLAASLVSLGSQVEAIDDTLEEFTLFDDANLEA